MSSHQRRILVVEDERTIAESVAARLRAEGFTVDLAHDGPTAVARARAGQPDLVVLDVMLPGFDGLEVCRRIQAERPVPVLMLTARGDETDLLVGLAVGRRRLPDQAVLDAGAGGAGARAAAPGRTRVGAEPGRGSRPSWSAIWRSTGPSGGSGGPASRRT